MLFGISGAHRTGKSTLAKAVAEELGIDYIPTSIGEVAQRYGFDPVAPMTLHQRVALQMHLLEDHLELIDGLKGPAILDRTPIDFVGYLLAEFHMQSHLLCDDKHLEAAHRYVDLCLKATRTRYDFLFVTCPLPDYKEEPGKPAMNLAYQWHHHMLVMGATLSLHGSVNYSIIREADRTRRQEFVHDAIVARLDAVAEMRKSARHIH